MAGRTRFPARRDATRVEVVEVLGDQELNESEHRADEYGLSCDPVEAGRQSSQHAEA